MPGKPTFVVMSFVMKRGRLAPGAKDIAPSSSGAVKRAEAQAARNAGSAALRIVADDESGEVEEAEILASFGQVPDDLWEQIRGG